MLGACDKDIYGDLKMQSINIVSISHHVHVHTNNATFFLRHITLDKIMLVLMTNLRTHRIYLYLLEFPRSIHQMTQLRFHSHMDKSNRLGRCSFNDSLQYWQGPCVRNGNLRHRSDVMCQLCQLCAIMHRFFPIPHQVQWYLGTRLTAEKLNQVEARRVQRILDVQ